MPSTTRVLAAVAALLAAVAGCLGEFHSLNILTCVYITGGDCPDSRIKFYLYTPLNPVFPEEIIYDNKSSNLAQLSFNPSLPTKLLIHGYNSASTIMVSLRRELLQEGDYNVVVLDWSELVRNLCYPMAAHNARYCGRCVAEVVNRMREHGARLIHLIGFSLGAHVPGFAAVRLRPFKLPWITGLDPAMPLFITSKPDDRLDASDADFVDVVHTNAMAQGKAQRCGDIDFYMNGGITQPGCRGDAGCNHNRALIYYTESVRSPKGFWGWPCGGILYYIIGLCPPRGTPQIMGLHVNHSARGFYVVKTNSEAPYAQGPWSPSPPEYLRSRAHLGGSKGRLPSPVPDIDSNSLGTERSTSASPREPAATDPPPSPNTV